jgi:hypothetical protein
MKTIRVPLQSVDPAHQGRTKHMRIQDFYIRERVAEGDVKVVYCNTKENVADIFTKPLPKDRFESLRDKLQVKDISHMESSGSVKDLTPAKKRSRVVTFATKDVVNNWRLEVACCSVGERMVPSRVSQEDDQGQAWRAMPMQPTGIIWMMVNAD